MLQIAIQSLLEAIEADDLPRTASWFQTNSDVRTQNESRLASLANGVKSSGMFDVLLQNGLTVEAVGQEWASGFGLSDIPLPVARHAAVLGVALTPHAAAALGLVESLSELLDRDPSLVHAKGGDGARPLHFSRTLEIAKLLVDRGAEIDPRDEDHDSTPAQWRIGDVPEITRFLLERGAQADIFMAAGLGDLSLAETLVAADPQCTTYRIGRNDGPFPGIGVQGRGGTIHQWTLGFNLSPHEVAVNRGHQSVFDFLWEHTPPRQQLLVACMRADRPTATQIAAQNPGLVAELDTDDRALLPKSCWETNLNPEAVRLMLDLGFPIDAIETNHGYQSLHNAAWCGDAALVELLLERGHPVDQYEPKYHANALGFAIHSATVAKRHPKGEFGKVVRLLLDAGTPLDSRHNPTGDPQIDGEIERFLQKQR